MAAQWACHEAKSVNKSDMVGWGRGGRKEKGIKDKKERHAESVEASLPNNATGAVEMLRQAQHDVL
ncbi:hypothetical protein GCM10023172_26870 [Hymenobacter ginsengisoli]|uniref:Uncharacterized protein n=1 Tax=Hymenobacter ginsengisoli TaxID=1051626 RepID=A0ABP8QI94_9BACT